jgi:hypothetical protein
VGGDTEYVWRLQAEFGETAFRKIESKVPLAFAMDDESSLTRTKQTHVRTIHFGVRQIYRAVARESHAGPGGTESGGSNRRYAAAPALLRGAAKGPIELDVLLMGNCSDPAIVTEMSDYLDDPALAGKRVGIFHWPDFKAPPSPLNPLYARLLLQGRALPVPPRAEVALATRLGTIFGDCTIEPDDMPVIVG